MDYDEDNAAAADDDDGDAGYVITVTEQTLLLIGRGGFLEDIIISRDENCSISNASKTCHSFYWIFNAQSRWTSQKLRHGYK